MIGNPYKGRGFAGVLQYLHFGRKDEPNPHRVAWHVARNMPTSDPDVVTAIMRATASLSPSVKKPVYHLPVSWPPDERLDPDTQLKVADRLIADLGLSEHQYTVIAHNDGDCSHLHIVANTVHPETGKVWNAWRDVYRIMESMERQERELGLTIVERSDLENRRGDGQPDSDGASRGEKKRAEREGDTVLVPWGEAEMRTLRRAITRHFREAASWEDLEARLDGHHLFLMRAGQGFRICDGSHFMTLSKIGKHAREDRLVERFGQSWKDYEVTRSLTRQEAKRLEPPTQQREEGGAAIANEELSSGGVDRPGVLECPTNHGETPEARHDASAELAEGTPPQSAAEQEANGHEHTETEQPESELIFVDLRDGADADVPKEAAPPGVPSEADSERSARAAALVEAWRWHQHYVAFRADEESVDQLTTRVATLRRELALVEVAGTKAHQQLAGAQEDYEQAIGTAFREPDFAARKLQTVLNAGHELETERPRRSLFGLRFTRRFSIGRVDPAEIGRLRGWRIWRFASPSRREAEEALKNISARHARAESLAENLHLYGEEWHRVARDIALGTRQLDEGHKRLGSDSMRDRKRAALAEQRSAALGPISKADIWRSDLPDEVKEELAAALVEEINKERGTKFGGERAGGEMLDDRSSQRTDEMMEQ
jgi:MobA/VirD2-like, nuclease domain